MKSRRYGRFSISRHFIDAEPDRVKHALRDCLVIEARWEDYKDAIGYVALSDKFDEIEPGMEPTYYRLEFYNDAFPRHEWHKCA